MFDNDNFERSCRTFRQMPTHLLENNREDPSCSLVHVSLVSRPRQCVDLIDKDDRASQVITGVEDRTQLFFGLAVPFGHYTLHRDVYHRLVRPETILAPVRGCHVEHIWGLKCIENHLNTARMPPMEHEIRSNFRQ